MRRVILLAPALALMLAAGPAAGPAGAKVAETNTATVFAEPLPGGDEGPDRGFYLGFALLGSSLTLDLDDRVTPMAPEFQFDCLGAGGELFCGIMFGPRFRLEFGGGGAVHDASPGDAKVVEAGARITGYVPLVPGRQVEPSLLAGLAATMVVFSGEEFEDRVYASASGDLGAGVRIRVTRHQFLQMSYLFSHHDVEREIIDIEGDDDDVDIRHVGGRGWSRTLRFGWGWDF